jgi:uncharacterized protein YndB with AHSA1/START domain
VNGSTKYQIRKSVFILAERERVFEAITNAEAWDEYFTSGMELDPRPGGVCNFRWENRGPDLICHESPGKVIEINKPSLFVFEWGAAGRKTTARLEIAAKYDGSVLNLFESGYPETDEGRRYMLECAADWGELLVLIKFYVEYGITYRSPSAGAAAE